MQNFLLFCLILTEGVELFEAYQQVWGLANNRMIAKIMGKMCPNAVKRIKTIKMSFPAIASMPR